MHCTPKHNLAEIRLLFLCLNISEQSSVENNCYGFTMVTACACVGHVLDNR